MRVKSNNLIMSLILLASSFALYVEVGNIDTTMSYALGPVFFPKLLTGILALLSLILLIQSIDVTGRKNWCAPIRVFDATAFSLRWSLVGVMLLYLLVLPLLGYTIATIPFLFVTMCLLGPRTPKNLVIYGITSVLVTMGLRYIFGTLLMLFLP